LRQGAAGTVQMGFVLGREGAFKGTPALAVSPARRRVGLCLLQSVFGSAQSRLEGLELLGLCRDCLLPGAGSARAMAGGTNKGQGLLFVKILVETVEVSIQLEKVVELRHEVLCDSPASWVRMREPALALGVRTTGDGCLASSLAAIHSRGSPW
jgi:hypothetical protein